MLNLARIQNRKKVDHYIGEAKLVKERLLEEIDLDRQSIAAQVEKIDIELKSLEIDHPEGLSLELRYRKMALDYYREKNMSALGEIEECIENLDQVSLAYVIYIHESVPGLPFQLAGRNDLPEVLAYTYRFKSPLTYNFDPDNLQSFRFHFRGLSVGIASEIRKEIYEAYLRRDVSEEFNKYATIYIEDRILPELLESAQTNIFIAKKIELVKHIVDLFNRHDFISLAHVLPSFIEGIFHEICSSMGLKSAKLEKASLKNALMKIKDQTDAFGIEYLLFEFPIRRNQIAHGRETTERYQDLAITFLLDLDLLVWIAKHREIPLNKLLEILTSKNLRTIRTIFQFPLPDLYENIREECFALGSWFASEEFWFDIEQQIGARDLEHRETEKFAKNLLCRAKLFGEQEVMDSIVRHAREFLKSGLSRAKERITEENINSARLIEKIRQLIGANDPSGT